IVPKNTKYTESLPVYIGTPAEKLPDSDETVRFVTFLQNIPVSEIEGVVKSMLNPTAQLIPQTSLNGMVITDCCYNIKSAMKVVHELDTSGYQETVTVMNLQTANAAEVKKLLMDIIKKPEQSSLARLLGYNSEDTTDYFAPSTKVIAEERTNSLILLGNKKSIEKVVNFVTTYIDKKLTKPKSPVHIYELEFADAEQIKNILDEVTNTPSQSAASRFGGIRNGVKYFNGVRIEADKNGNRLIVSCVDQQDWKFIRNTIKDLDKPQPQVAIETLIVQIDQTDLKEFGGQVHNAQHGSPIKGVDFQGAGIGPIQVNESGSNITSILGNLLNTLSSGLSQGTSVLSLSKGGSVWALFKALKSQTNATILDRPFVTVANRVEATVSVGENRRIEKESAGDQTGYETVNVATTIKFKPQINPDGIINLKVNVDLSEFVDTEGLQRDTKQINTNVTVANGQVLVLGGFVKTKVTESGGKTPILGNIPILGWLCKNKSRSAYKNYIFLFVCPTIIKPRQSPGTNLYTKMKLHDATQYIEETVETQVVKDPIHNWFFNPDKENYSHKVVDFANARYQPTTVDIRTDPYYRSGGEVSFAELQSTKDDTTLPIKFAPRKSTQRHFAKRSEIDIEEEPIPVEDDLDGQRSLLRQLVAKNSSKPLSRDDIATPRGKFKTFISTHPAEKERQKYDSAIEHGRKEFKKFIAHEKQPLKSPTQTPEKSQFKDFIHSTQENSEVHGVAKNIMQPPKVQFKRMLTENYAPEEEMPQEARTEEQPSQNQHPQLRNIRAPSLEHERNAQRSRLKSLMAENTMENPFKKAHPNFERE
ncbi:hypothetical protein KAU11_04365, partial [Candidatus Babeliales bacterium]|nr:hypothetical protein [Candidatus Babeliales bacterium]